MKSLRSYSALLVACSFVLSSCGYKGPLVEYCLANLIRENGVVVDIDFACTTKAGEDIIRKKEAVENWVLMPYEDAKSLLKYCNSK